MKHLLRRAPSLLLALLLVCGLCVPALATPPAPVPAEHLTILFTHDTHDHFYPLPKEGGGEYGGYTRLATLLKEKRAAATEPVITVDGGDFSMGSLFQTIYASYAPELHTLGLMGYDAVTLGNHEFDYRGKGLADMLTAAKDAPTRPAFSSYFVPPYTMPALVLANYKPDPASEDAAAVTAAMKNFPVQEYITLNRDGLRIGIFGVMGVDADECAPMSGMVLEPAADAAKRIVAEMKTKEEYDFIICLSHSGTSSDPKKSEDELLAKAVPELDVIISGHTHSTLAEPKQVGNTLIVSAGEYTQNLGVLTVEKNTESGAVSAAEYRLVPVDETVSEDMETVSFVSGFQHFVETEYLSQFGMTSDQVLANSPFDFTPISKFAAGQEDDALGALITDGYISAVKEAEGENYVPIDVAVVNSGVVRASFAEGKITVSDAFNVSSLGVGADGTPGYPLISVYLTGKELRDACEVDASVTPLMSAAQLYMAGLNYSFNTSRMIFNKVTDVEIARPDGSTAPLENDKLYRCVTGLYSGQMLGAVNSKSFGILTITPKDKDGNVITNFEDHIVHNQNGAEVKEWYALASYLKAMGIVDEIYAQPLGRKNVISSLNPVELLKNPNVMTFIAIGVVLLLLAILILVPTLIVRHHKKKRSRYSGK